MEQQINVPEQRTSHNVMDIGDLLNGKEGAALLFFGSEYKEIRETSLETSDSADSIYDLVSEYVKKNPYTHRRRDKKKTKLQFMFEENHYPAQRPMYPADHPVNARAAKEPWSMNPGRLYIPKHVGDRMREIQHLIT